MKYFVVSDVHGCAGILKKTLESGGYDPENPDHMLVCCGDFFDRGTENFEVLKFFERLPRKIMIKGNHDERLLEILNTGKLIEHDALNGTFTTIEEFFGKYTTISLDEPLDFSGSTGTVRRLTEFIGEMVDYYETENYVFVHGWLPINKGTVVSDWRKASPDQWHAGRWTSWVNGSEMPGRNEVKTVVCGHYPVWSQGMYYGEGFIAIDAGTVATGRMNLLVISEQ